MSTLKNTSIPHPSTLYNNTPFKVLHKKDAPITNIFEVFYNITFDIPIKRKPMDEI